MENFDEKLEKLKKKRRNKLEMAEIGQTWRR